MVFSWWSQRPVIEPLPRIERFKLTLVNEMLGVPDPAWHYPGQLGDQVLSKPCLEQPPRVQTTWRAWSIGSTGRLQQD
jgi:hypothetical protein